MGPPCILKLGESTVTGDSCSRANAAQFSPKRFTSYMDGGRVPIRYIVFCTSTRSDLTVTIRAKLKMHTVLTMQVDEALAVLATARRSEK